MIDESYSAKVWKTGTSLVITLDSLVVKKLNIHSGDEVEVLIKKNYSSNSISIKCPNPECRDIFIVNNLQDSARCESCGEKILNKDFDIIYNG